MTNESAVLGLLAELYQRNAALQAEVNLLRAELARLTEADAEPTGG